MYHFEKDTKREQTNSFKWKCLKPLYGREDLYPMWVADMEFEASPAIQERLKKRVEEGVYGYEMLSEKYYKAVRGWLMNRHQYEVELKDIVYCANIMVGLHVILQALTEEGEEVLVNTPAYGNFFQTIEGCKRRVCESRLIKRNGRYEMDFADMEQKVTEKTKLFLLCNPQNPTGTVWTRNELEEIVSFCRKHALVLVSDEVHYDFVFQAEHTMAAKIAENQKVSVISLIAPSKTFNVAGIQTATILAKDGKLRESISATMKQMAYPFEHAFAEAVTIAAYEESEEWLEEMLEYIDENRKLFFRFVNERIPVLEVTKSQGTYLMWVDCSGMGMSEEELAAFWKEECRLALSAGREFRGESGQFVRFNIACRREKLLEVLERVETVCRRIKRI